jgi:hypothetical protein
MAMAMVVWTGGKMKIRKVDGFRPIQITLENEDEAAAMHRCLYDARYSNASLSSHRKNQRDEMENLFKKYLEVYKI